MLGAVNTTLCWSSWGPAVFGGTVAPSSQWRHIAVTNSASHVLLYLDGVLVGAQNAAINTLTGPGYEMLFGFGDSTRRLDGAVDEVRVYDRALSSAEIAEVAAGNGY